MQPGGAAALAVYPRGPPWCSNEKQQTVWVAKAALVNPVGQKTEPIDKGVGKGGILGPEGNRGGEENLNRIHCVHIENWFCLRQGFILYLWLAWNLVCRAGSG